MWLTPPTPVPVTQIYTPFTPVSLLSWFLPLSYSFPYAPVSQFSLRPPFTVFLIAFLVPLSYSFPLFPCLTVFLVSPFPTALTPFLDMDTSRISNVHCLLACKPHVAVWEGASSFLFVLQHLLTVQNMDKSCISCYLAIHHFCYYITERLPTCLCPVQWYCYLSCVLLGILIYWDILVLKVYLVSKQVSR